MNIGNKNKNYKIKEKKLLIVNLHFWPDKSSCSAILYHIANELSKEIKCVEIITSRPKKFNSNFTKSELKKYDNRTDLKIYRLSLLKEDLSAFPRVFNALVLGLFTIFKLFISDYEMVIATSSPPILTAFIISTFAKLKQIRFIYYCMDINPEVGILSGDFKNKLLTRFLLFLDNCNCINANPTIVHSMSMKNALLKRFKKQKININIVNSLTVPSKRKEVKVIKSLNNNLVKSGLQIIFAGNIGRFQGLENIIHAFKYLIEYKDIRLTIMGEGFEKSKLKKLNNKLGTNVEFRDFTSYDQAKVQIENADLGLVSLIPNMYKYAYPSKTMAYLEQGIPILAMIEKESDLAQDIINENIGFVIPINQHRKLANLLINLNKNRDWESNLRKNCLHFFNREFSDKVIINKWKKIIYN